MSILIRGMEMPKSCEKCPFLDYEEGFCFASGVRGKNGWYEFTWCPSGIKEGRHNDCPLSPVPPHGRLIDADAFSSEMKERQTAAIKWMRESVQDHDAFIRAEATVAFLSEVKLTLDKMPTIITENEKDGVE